ncbi:MULTISPECIES: hypothetical protein [unclassified Halomonas]|uniref:hypothetical protein n=1 Tax=unclassified Halomonas TaxID=2609666 RepID=UPI0009904E34|nr:MULTISPECIES: hypothetical protein [unclassified Halomonas]AQU84490.1 hypothetical protein B2G49_18990 [Halomonas sp. 'Soap Lake \
MKPLSRHSVTSKTSDKHYIASLVMIGLLASNMVSAEANGNMLNLINEGFRVSQYSYQIDTSLLQGNVSIIEQQGHNNHASIAQSRSAHYQLSNFSKIYQYGNNNQAAIIQNNGNNVGVIWQVGDNQTANISQQGNNFSLRADIYQIGFNGDVTISQSGSGQRSVSVQQQNYSSYSRPVTIDTY